MLGLNALSKGSAREKLQLSFVAYDVDNSGKVTRAELERVLTDFLGAGADDAAVLAACARAGLTFDDDFTLDKDCGERGGKLSGGQQQRVSLARAILRSRSAGSSAGHLPTTAWSAPPSP